MRTQGTVKWFNTEKGYGFITPESGDDHYFNVRNIKGAQLPSNGDTVEFASRVGSDRGPRAVEVVIVGSVTKDRSSNDDRIQCDSCHKKIVPRLITQNGSLQRSVCPYCGSTVKDFSPPIFLIAGFIITLVALALYFK